MELSRVYPVLDSSYNGMKYKNIIGLLREGSLGYIRYEPKGQISKFPLQVLDKMLDYQIKQGNKGDIKVFEKNKGSLKHSSGFDWDSTDEGFEFWERVITNENFGVFFKKYPELEEKALEANFIKQLKHNTNYTNPFIKKNLYVTKSEAPEGDMIPIVKPKYQQIFNRMLNYQKAQGNRLNKKIFFNDRKAGMIEGGFDWDLTEEGFDFWKKILVDLNLDTWLYRIV